MKKVLIGILGLSLVVACNSGSSESEGENVEIETSVVGLQNVSPQTAAELLKNGDVILIDVRTADEYAGGHIEGSMNMNFNSAEFENSIADLDPSLKYMVYCHSGRRSANSAELMADLGFENIYNIQGGIAEWQGNGFDVVSK